MNKRLMDFFERMRRDKTKRRLKTAFRRKPRPSKVTIKDDILPVETHTIEQYEVAIPECCAYQTIEEHENIMLCWGLVRAEEEGRKMNCDNCTENTTNKKESDNGISK